MARDPREQAEETARIVEDAFRNIAANVQDIFNDALDASDTFGKTLGKDITKNLNSIARSQNQIISNAEKLALGEAKSKDIRNQILKQKVKEEQIERQIQIAMDAGIDVGDELLRQKQESIDYNEQIIGQLNEQLDLTEDIENLSSPYEKMAKDIKSIPGIGRSLAGPFESMAKGAKNTATSLVMSGKKAKGLGAGMKVAGGAFKGLAKGIAGSAGGPFLILTKLAQVFVNALLGANAQAVELSRNLGLNNTQAEQFKTTIDDIAFRGMNAAVANSKNLQKALFAQNKSLGFNLQANIETSEIEKQRLSQVTDINERLGLSEQSFSNLLNLSRVTGESEKDILDTINSTVYQVGLQNKMMFNTREILEEVLQTSDSIALQFSFNVREIAKATAEAKLLGFSLSDIEGTQSNMLNFESSIAAELEAEILTNKELNLERARAFALQGDLLNLGKELSREMGTFAEFQDMNILQQNALAKAVGMSREELTNVFKEQEKVQSIQKLMADEKFKEYAIEQLKMKGMKDLSDNAIKAFIRTGALTGKYAKVLGEDLTASLKRETAQKNFERSLESLQEILTRLVNSNVLDYLANTFERFAMAIAGGQSLTGMFFRGGLSESAIEKGKGELGTKNRAIEVVQQGANAITPFAEGGIVTQPTRALIGEAGAEAVIPLNEFNAKLDQLIAAVTANRDVYMDGRLVGDAIEARSFK